MAKFAQEARMNGKIYAPSSKKAFKNTRLGLLYLLAPHSAPCRGDYDGSDDSDAPPGLRKPSRWRITLNLCRGPCKESFNHSPDLGPFRASPAWLRESLEQGKPFLKWCSPKSSSPQAGNRTVISGEALARTFRSCEWYDEQTNLIEYRSRS
jgi:hypothetical protein